MSTNLTCFVFGIPLTLAWFALFKKGFVFGPNLRKLYRDEDPIPYWIITVLYGVIFLGFLIMPVLDWLGLR